MSQNSASIPNPALAPFGVLIGSWTTTGTHPLVPGTVLHGRTTFAWLENGAFLLERSQMDDPRFPAGLSIYGSDDALQEYYLLYFDSRGVSRKFAVDLHGNTFKMWRAAPGFSQRFTLVIAQDGSSLLKTAELSRDDATWQKDLELTYTRAS